MTKGGDAATHDDPLPGDADPNTHEPREHVLAIFAADREGAEAYAEAMRGRGYDPWHTAMGAGDRVRHTVELSYPATLRARFAADHVDALEEIGATAEVEVLEEPVRAGTTLERLIEGHLAARDARESTVAADVPDSPTPDPSVTAHEVPTPAQTAETQARGGRLTAREYLALPARERARIPAERIPDGAFGAESLADVAHQARGASRALERGRERHVVPSIGERG